MIIKQKTKDQLKQEPKGRHDDPYGNLVELNTHRLIADAVGNDLLKVVIEDYLSLLESAVAIYEKNGDYAYGIFASGWCRFMNQSSRCLAETDDNKEALESGKWHCHESFWKVAKASIDRDAPVSQPCLGGRQTYAVPIFAQGETVGSMSFSYGDPPQNPEKLRELAERYHVDVDELSKLSKAYKPQPPEAIERAKKRLQTAARAIGIIVERKLSDDQRIHELKLFKNLINQSNDAIFVIDPETGRFLDVNNKVSESLGYSRKELLKMKAKDIGTTIFDDQSWQKLVTKIRQNDSMFIQGEQRRKDGIVFPVEINSKIIKEADGEYLVVVARDITERKRTEAKVYLQSSALNAAADPIVITDSEGIIEWANPAFTIATGYTSKEALGKTLRFLKSGKQDVNFYRDLWQTIKSGKIWRGEIINRRKDGTFYTEEQAITPVKNEQGEITHFIAVKLDITKRKIAEQRIKESELKYSSIFHEARDGMVLFKAETGCITDCNKEFERMTVKSLDELQKLKIWDLFEQIKQGKVSSLMEGSYRCPDGSVITIEFFLKSISLDGKQYVQSVVRDITERKKMEESLKKSKSEMENKNIALNEVIGQIEIEKKHIRDNVTENVEKVLIPLLEKMKLNGASKKYIRLLEHHLKDLVSSYGRRITKKQYHLVPRELEVCSMVKEGMASKEIAKLLNISLATVETHRRNIRRKIGLSNKEINLTTFLRTR